MERPARNVENNHFSTVYRCSYIQDKLYARKVHQADADSVSSNSNDAYHKIGSVAKVKKSKMMMIMTFKTAYPAGKAVQLDSGATCRAVSMWNLQEVLHSGADQTKILNLPRLGIRNSVTTGLCKIMYQDTSKAPTKPYKRNPQIKKRMSCNCIHMWAIWSDTALKRHDHSTNRS